MLPFQYDVDPTGWWVMNIPNGIRAIWNGKLFDHYETKHDMPSIALDGILQHESGDRKQLIHALQNNWVGVTYVVFDTPSDDIFEIRMCTLRKLKNYSHISIAPYKNCHNLKHLMEESQPVWLIVPHSKYKQNWFKVSKLIQESGKIIRINYNSYITVQVSHNDIIVPLILPKQTIIPKIGSNITYEYKNISSRGYPVFPRIVQKN